MYWVNMNANILIIIEHYSACLEYQNMQAQKKTLPHKVPAKLCQVVGADIFMVTMKIYCAFEITISSFQF